MKTATYIKNVDGTGDGRVYRVSPPMGESGEYEHVWVSAINSAFDTGVPETYIFGCDEDGGVMDWGELPGSLRGVYDHEEALRNAGYTVVPN